MHGFLSTTHRRRQRKSARRHIRYGKRAAALRAITGAKIYASGAVPTLTEAAECTGSNVPYIRAALVLIKADPTLVHRVVADRMPLMAAAAEARRRVNLITAYKAATDSDRIAFARVCGPDAILNVLAAVTVVS
jgi:hypothetical protein